MGNAKCIGRVGGLAVALGVGNVRHAAARMTVSVVVAAVVVAVMPARESTVSAAVKLSADSTALIMGGTSVPTPDDAYIEIVKNQFIAPTHPGELYLGIQSAPFFSLWCGRSRVGSNRCPDP